MQATVHLVDDDAAFRSAVGKLLLQAGYAFAPYASARDLLRQLPPDEHSGCILLDVKIPDITGPELQNLLRQKGSTLPIIFITGFGDFPTSVRTIKAGAEDFLAKPVSRDQLLEAIHRALIHQSEMRDTHRRRAQLRRLLAELTPRQREVFNLVVKGKLNKQIAFDIGATERTVKAHRHEVMEKLQVKTLAELVRLAQVAGLLDEIHRPEV